MTQDLDRLAWCKSLDKALRHLMKTVLSFFLLAVSLAGSCQLIASIPGASVATTDPMDIPDTVYIPTNRVEWTCPAVKIGGTVTNDVVYVVKNIQTNRTGVFVVSYPVLSPVVSNAPVVLEYLIDPRPRTFHLETEMMYVQPGIPGIEVVKHVVVTVGPIIIDNGHQSVRYFGYVDIGRIFCSSRREVMFGRITEPTLRARISGERK